jgi:branched-chain amino acid transport system ATP-binding protein
MTALLRIIDVRAVYGGSIRALDGVSLEVREGEIACLIGANGAGKTTLLKTASGLLRPESSTIEYAGRSIAGRPAWETARAGLAHVPEGRRIFPRLTVLENLELGAYGRGRPSPEDLDRVFGLFPVLAERRSQLGGTLSGGQQQMLAIGRALMSRPRLLMLDEPSMGLAPNLVQRIFEIVAAVNRSGTTVLLVEQNAQKALAVSTRGYVLETGRVTLSGPAAQLAADPRVREAYLGVGGEAPHA